MNRLIEEMARTSQRVRKRASQHLRALGHPAAPTRVVFLAGVQRSGTNMVMDVFERSAETDVYHESDPRAFDAFELRPRHVLHDLVRSSPARHVVFKALCELQDLRALLDDFAPARSVWILRRLEDVVNSHLVLWTGMPRYLAAIVEDRNGALWRGRGMSDETHALVKTLNHPAIANASACALFWYFRNVLFFEQALERDGRVIAVRYESLVTDPASEFARIFEFLDLPYTAAAFRKVSAGSVRKRPAPEIDPAIREVCDGLAARFDQVLEAGTARREPGELGAGRTGR
jgi:hypothetical protein